MLFFLVFEWGKKEGGAIGKETERKQRVRGLLLPFSGFRELRGSPNESFFGRVEERMEV